MKPTMKEMLQRPFKVDNTNSNIPARLARNLLAMTSIKPMEWEALMDVYFKNKHADDRRKIREEKTNLVSALEKDNLSWARLEQVLNILGPETVDITVALKYPADVMVETKVSMRTRRRGEAVDPSIQSFSEKLIKEADNANAKVQPRK